MKIVIAIHCKTEFMLHSDILATMFRIDFEDKTSKFIQIQHPITNITLSEGLFALAEAIKNV